MQETGLYAQGFHRRTASYGKGKSIEEAVKENFLHRRFNQDGIDTVRVADIPYIPCLDGRLYLFAYTDLATRILRCLTFRFL